MEPKFLEMVFECNCFTCFGISIFVPQLLDIPVLRVVVKVFLLALLVCPLINLSHFLMNT